MDYSKHLGKRGEVAVLPCGLIGVHQYSRALVQIRVESTPIEDVKIVQPEIFRADRGIFTEVYSQDQFQSLGLPPVFAQLNHSRSARNDLRGFHFQWEPPMGKLMRTTEGTAFLVAVDIRKGLPTLGKWLGRELSAATKTRRWTPAGFARGFCVLCEFAEINGFATMFTIRKTSRVLHGTTLNWRFHGRLKTPLFRARMRRPNHFPSDWSGPNPIIFATNRDLRDRTLSVASRVSGFSDAARSGVFHPMPQGQCSRCEFAAAVFNYTGTAVKLLPASTGDFPGKI